MATKKAPLPKNFWDIVEKYLPNYYSRQDVADNNDLVTKSHAYLGDKRTLSQLDKSNRKLYEEALMAKNGTTNAPKKTKAPVAAQCHNYTILVEDSNGDHSVMVVRLTHKNPAAFNLNPAFAKARKAYGKDDGSMTQEDHIEAQLKKAGFTVEWPLGNYTTVEA
jgi:hypothetical protein